MVDFGRSDDVRKRNRRRILTVLRRYANVSRKHISQETGLSASTVSAITSELLDEAVIVSLQGTEDGALRRGRPQVRLSLNPNAALVASAVQQLDRIAVTVCDYTGKTVAEIDRAFRAREAGPEEFPRMLIETISDALTSLPPGAGQLERIELGVQGITDVEGTAMLWSPITRYRNIGMKEALEKAFGVPARVSNDCCMIALALHWREPERFASNFAAVLLSHGIGMGLMLNDVLVTGIRSSATEFGHLSHMPRGALCRCGRSGCIEAYAGDYAIYRRATNAGPQSAPRNDIAQVEISQIIEAAKNGDKDATAAFTEAGEALGTGLANMFALVDPFPVALVGSGTRAFDFIEGPLRRAIGDINPYVSGSEIEISCFPNEKPLIMEGCTMTALLELDEEIARSTAPLQKVFTDAV